MWENGGTSKRMHMFSLAMGTSFTNYWMLKMVTFVVLELSGNHAMDFKILDKKLHYPSLQ